jgi:hypothetical protein
VGELHTVDEPRRIFAERVLRLVSSRIIGLGYSPSMDISPSILFAA